MLIAEMSKSRVGIVIKWPLNGQFHDARDFIITSRMAVREMVDKVKVDEWLLGKILMLLLKR